MADQAIPAVATTTESSLPACTTSIDSLMSLPERAVPLLTDACQAVRANEQARLAALSLGQVSTGNPTFEWVPLALADCSNTASNDACAAAEQGNNPWSIY